MGVGVRLISRVGGVVIVLRISIGIDTSSLGRGVVSAVGTVAGAFHLLVCYGVRAGHGTTSIAGFVAGAHIRATGGETASCTSTTSQLSVTSGVIALLAVPEVTLARARRVVVSWRWAEALLLAVMTDERDLDQGGNDEENGGDNGNGEHGGVQAASQAEMDGICDLAVTARAGETAVLVGGTITDRCLDIAFARAGATAGQDCNGNHATGEAEIEDNGEEGEKSNAPETTGQKHGEDEVDNGGAGNAFDGFFRFGDEFIAVSEDGEEIAWANISAWFDE